MNPFELAAPSCSRRGTPSECWPPSTSCCATASWSGHALSLVRRTHRARVQHESGAAVAGRAARRCCADRVREGAGSSTLDVTVGARHEFVVFGWFWTLLSVLGGGYQLCAPVPPRVRGRGRLERGGRGAAWHRHHVGHRPCRHRPVAPRPARRTRSRSSTAACAPGEPAACVGAQPLLADPPREQGRAHAA